MRHITIALMSIILLFTGIEGRAAQGPDARASAVESKMTDAERVQLLHGIMALPFPGGPPIPPGIKMTSGYIQGVPRLGIPDLLETDASLGVVNPVQLRPGDNATALPSGLALAATFNPDTAFKAGVMIGAEAHAKGFNILLGGGVNLARDPRNGRNFEYLGEDPLLAGTLGGEAIRGTQSQGVVSTVKHFALNDQETQRATLDARIDEAGFRESDLLAFELAIERGQPGSVMCGYNKINGDYACGNDFILNHVLKGDWAYKGWVMSDWGATQDVSYLTEGLDQESGEQLDKQVWLNGPLQAQMAAGRVSKARVSDAVRRILRSLYAVHADGPLTESPIDFAAHATVARSAAVEGIVLLKNTGVLPLSATLRSVAVIGGHADIGVLSGGGSSEVTPHGDKPTIIPIGGSGDMGAYMHQLYIPSSPLKALQTALPSTAIYYDSGYDVLQAAAVAARADLAIVFATQWQIEGMDAGMALPEGQNDLIAAVARANPHTVVVLETGNAVTMPWLNDVKAVVEAWYPGQEGGAAIADILTGAVNPSGRLPISFPVDSRQNPRPAISGLGAAERTAVTVSYSEGSNVGYRWFAARGATPLFPFGYGLSYAHFAASGLKLTEAPMLTATLVVTNAGATAGATAAQIYLVSAAGVPLKRLAGFSKVALLPGENREIHIAIDPRLLARWDISRHQWRIDAGKYVFAIGDSADALSETAGISLRSQKLRP
jgi:beta-glucosidase